MTRCQEPGYCSEVVNLKCSDPRRAISALASSRLCVSGTYSIWEANMSSTTIESRKFRIPSDLRRQPGYRPVSSKVGDHLRILLGVVVHSFSFGSREKGMVSGCEVHNRLIPGVTCASRPPATLSRSGLYAGSYHRTCQVEVSCKGRSVAGAERSNRDYFDLAIRRPSELSRPLPWCLLCSVEVVRTYIADLDFGSIGPCY